MQDYACFKFCLTETRVELYGVDTAVANEENAVGQHIRVGKSELLISMIQTLEPNTRPF